MTSVCPQGHQSAAIDYCDTCGAPMHGDADSGAPTGARIGSAEASVEPGQPVPPATPPSEQAAASAPGSSSTPATRPCPHCGLTNDVEDLFCEACGYDFTTGTPPMGGVKPVPSSLDLDAPVDVPAPESEPEPDPIPGPGPATGPIAIPMPVVETGIEALPIPTIAAPQVEPIPMPVVKTAASDSPTPSAPPAPHSEPRRRPQYRPPSRDTTPDWVVEVWIDPEWYAVQRSDQDCPSPDVPDIAPVRGRNMLVGRPSATRNVHPDVDCGADTGVSRRHAQFTSDGRRWWIEDLGSANGTYVGTAGDPLPVDPIAVGRKMEVDAADRIYVGAWTRMVIRPATESERSGTG